MDWIKLIADKPDSFLILLAAVLTFVFYLGQLLERIKGVQVRQAVVADTLKIKADRAELANLVTKEDLKLAMSEFAAQLAKDLKEGFVSITECELKHRQAYIPIAEHAKVLADIENLKEIANKK